MMNEKAMELKGNNCRRRRKKYQISRLQLLAEETKQHLIGI